MRKVTVICTILNEEKTISALLDGIKAQTYQPSSVIIADGGSTDKSLQIISKWQKKHKSFPLQVIKVAGNRSKGRNAAISKSSSTYIAITDAGCIPEPDWLEKLLESQHEAEKPVVAGYYRGLANSAFEEAVIPYVLVMPDKVDPNNFLPATRSMLMDKSVWRKLGGFDEKLSDNEDYDFARRMKHDQVPIAFARDAVVNWLPRRNLSQFFNMIYRFARGDAQARLFRPKVLLIFLRYLIAISIFVLVAIFTKDINDMIALVLLYFVIYGLWAVHKNVRYTPKGWYWLPVLQVTSDMAVMLGTIHGIWKNIYRSRSV